MSASFKTIDYYFSPISPWTYLGHQRLSEIAKRHSARINVKPADYGPIFAASGGLPLPQRSNQRQAYRLADLQRWRDYLQLPLNLHPKFFPADATRAAHMILAAKAIGEQSQMRLTGAILRACWVEERNIADPDVLMAIANEQAVDPNALDFSSAAEQFQATTQEALVRQVFGAPSFVYRNEIFWGQDRLDFLDRALAK